jgi:hypothetical protein
MEYEVLESIWAKYNDRLDNLEKINKLLLKETLLKRPKRKLNWHRFQSIFGLIMGPIIPIVALHPRFQLVNIDYKFILGCSLIFGVIFSLGYYYFRSYYILKKINLSTNSLLESAKSINHFRIVFEKHRKLFIFYVPVMFAGYLLIAWNGFDFSSRNIFFLLFLFSIIFIWMIKGTKSYRDDLKHLEKEIVDLKEYID